MSDVAVRAEHLGKKYVIGHQQSGDFREAFGARIRNLFHPTPKKDFWALKDVDFEIKRGEAVGIIGRNGAGKSTLLKILSRITYPTTGRFELNGRVSSLLEVGTGFHPELTGRENIFLNGTILGMGRSEIKRKFDEIVDFSGVEEFIDTPVKHYSSGMKVRLAFSVAAHLEPDILIVDEVLAVGDAEFQKKCLGKMDEVRKGEGRTVLFVSHNMTAIESLCTQGIVMQDGILQYRGNLADCIQNYLKNAKMESIGMTWSKVGEAFEKKLEILKCSVSLEGSQPQMKLLVQVDLRSNHVHQDAFIAYDLLFEDNSPVLQAIPTDVPFIRCADERQCITSVIDLPPLIPGEFKLSVWVGSHYADTLDWQREIISFKIETSPMQGRSYPHSRRNGYLVAKSSIVS